MDSKLVYLFFIYILCIVPTSYHHLSGYTIYLHQTDVPNRWWNELVYQGTECKTPGTFLRMWILRNTKTYLCIKRNPLGVATLKVYVLRPLNFSWIIYLRDEQKNICTVLYHDFSIGNSHKNGIRQLYIWTNIHSLYQLLRCLSMSRSWNRPYRESPEMNETRMCKDMSLWFVAVAPTSFSFSHTLDCSLTLH